MSRDRASADEWERYYRRAERIRAIAGDPFRRYVAKAAARERAWMVGCALVLLAFVGAFCALALQP
jgi:hypothetical protein